MFWVAIFFWIPLIATFVAYSVKPTLIIVTSFVIISFLLTSFYRSTIYFVINFHINAYMQFIFSSFILYNLLMICFHLIDPLFSIHIVYWLRGSNWIFISRNLENLILLIKAIFVGPIFSFISILVLLSYLEDHNPLHLVLIDENQLSYD